MTLPSPAPRLSLDIQWGDKLPSDKEQTALLKDMLLCLSSLSIRHDCQLTVQLEAAASIITILNTQLVDKLSQVPETSSLRDMITSLCPPQLKD